MIIGFPQQIRTNEFPDTDFLLRYKKDFCHEIFAILKKHKVKKIDIVIGDSCHVFSRLNNII